MKQRVVVIGSGLGGLECALLLARQGLDVTVLEQGAQPGGAMQSYTRRGLDYDTGLHYVGGLAEGQTLRPFFDCLGLMRLPWRRLDAEFERILIGERSFALAQGYDAFVERLARDFPTERAALQSYARLLADEERRQIALFDPAATSSPFATGLPDRGAYDYLCETFTSPLLRDVLSATATKMELRRESLPLFSFVHATSSFIESSWRLEGGGRLIVEHLVDSIGQQGGRVVCGARVEALDCRDGRIMAARCANGEHYEADAFIGDIHPARLIDMVQPEGCVKRMFRLRLDRTANTFGMFTVSLRLKEGALPYFNYNRYVYRRPDVWGFYAEPRPGDGVMLSCRVPQDGSRWARQVDLLTPMPWSACSRWLGTKPMHRDAQYAELKATAARQCIALAERAIPGLASMVEAAYTSTPLTYHDYLLSPEGTAYGMRKDFHAPMLSFLSPRSPLANLIFTGQSVMLHGVQGVTLQAFATCAALLGKDKVWQLIKQHNN